ncbi:MAG: isoaspartyl peptidase/L-asparaginase [Acidobacteria bacterium]|nr:isoaspartyl peptidase/L-asparaginase [Acidobacteriota bacterium]
MRNFCFTLVFLFGGVLIGQTPFAIAIHGGAGTIRKSLITPEQEKAYVDKLSEAIDAGYAVLESGGSATDAVERTLMLLEDSPLFNAGKGAVFAHSGRNELDASIMQGSGEAGAVAGVLHIRNPIRLARKVMENSNHVLLSGEGAEQFAQEQGVALVDPTYFYTERQWEALQAAIKDEQAKPKKMGTVGCVALDQNGNLAAGTSTGGLTNKKFGRIGDSPIIGAGTFAENGVAGVSCTGQGEYFIRNVIAYEVIAQMKWAKRDLAQATQFAIHEKLQKSGGIGGLVALDAQGNVSFAFNTEGMYRGYRKQGESANVAIYGPDK